MGKLLTTGGAARGTCSVTGEVPKLVEERVWQDREKEVSLFPFSLPMD